MSEIKKFILSQLGEKKISQQDAVNYLKELQRLSTESDNKEIAVVGVSCRLPMADNVDEYWDNIINGRNCFVAKPEEKLLLGKPLANPYYAEFLELDPYEDKAEELENFVGAYIKDIDKFDANFFGIPPREARYIDPGQRVFLETAWGAIEDAGYSADTIKDTKTGVFVGKDNSNSIHYKYITEPDAMKLTGNWEGIMASRISYIYNFRGPAMVVDTACSSGLVAVHEACNALRNGECSMALAGGIAIGAGSVAVDEMDADHGDEEGQDALGAVRSNDNRVRTFDKKCSGSVFGEGVVVFMLKRAQDAIKDHDHIYGIIKGSALNNDGASNGITAPNPNAQEEVIEEAWRRAGVEPETINYVEAHGTGTLLGDPIEIIGLTNAFQKHTKRKQFCGIGSVKTNIGHLVGASGCASMLKVLLAMGHDVLPPSINFEEPNPHINFQNSPLYVVDQPTKWVKEDTPRRAGINAFGFSGTNCHLVLEEFEGKKERSKGQGVSVITISAKTETSLKELVKHYQAFLEVHTELNLDDVSYTTTMGRGHYEHRIILLCSTVEEFKAKIDTLCKEGIKDYEDKGIYAGKHKIVSDRRQYKEAGEVSESELFEITEEAEKILANVYILENAEELKKLCKLYTKGAEIQWAKLYDGKEVYKVSLPTYAFDRIRQWGDMKFTSIDGELVDGKSAKMHPLVEKCIAETMDESIYLIKFNLTDHWMLQEHKILGSNIVPGTTYIEVCKEACRQYFHSENVEFDSIMFISPLMVTPVDEFVETHIILKKQDGGVEFTVVSKHEDEENGVTWEKHAQGKMHIHDGVVEKQPRYEAWMEKANKEEIPMVLPDEESSAGVYLGPRWHCFQDITKIKENNRELIITKMEIQDKHKADLKDYNYHPSMADAALNIPLQVYVGGEIYLPYSYRGLKIYRKIPERFYSILEKTAGTSGGDTLTFRAVYADLEGNTIATIDEYVTKKVNRFNNYVAAKYYQLEWKAIEETGENLSTYIPEGNILVLKDADGKAEAFSEKISNEKNNIFFISYGSSYQKIDANHYQIVGTEEDYETFLKDANLSSLSYVYHFATVGKKEAQITVDNYQQKLDKGLYSLFYMNKVFQKQLKGGISFFLISDYANVVTKEEQQVKADNTSFLALAKSLAGECPNYRFRCLDIDAETDFETICQEILSEDTSVFRMAIRNGVKYTEVLGETDISRVEETQFTVTKEGVFVITGGTGGLGLETALYLSDLNPCNICLLARSEMPEREEWDKVLEENTNQKQVRMIQAIRTMEEKGSNVILRYSDTADYEKMKTIFTELRSEYGKIRGVVHCAGVAGEGFLINKELKTFNQVISPKMLGTITIGSLLQKDEVEFMILFSSMQTLFGGAGQGDYTAGNSFLDTYCKCLQNNGIHAKTINWPGWSETGMAVDFQVTDDMVMFKSLTNRRAIMALHTVITHDITNVVPGEVSYEFVAKVGAENLPFALAKKLQTELKHFTEKNSNNGTAVAKKTINIDELVIIGKKMEEYTDIEKEVAAIYATVLNLEEIDIYESFNSMGGDSIIATEVFKVLTQRFGDILNISDMFSYATVEDMAQYITSRTSEESGEKESVEDYSKMMQQFETGEINIDKMIDYFDEE